MFGSVASLCTRLKCELAWWTALQERTQSIAVASRRSRESSAGDKRHATTQRADRRSTQLWTMSDDDCRTTVVRSSRPRPTVFVVVCMQLAPTSASAAFLTATVNIVVVTCRCRKCYNRHAKSVNDFYDVNVLIQLTGD